MNAREAGWVARFLCGLSAGLALSVLGCWVTAVWTVGDNSMRIAVTGFLLLLPLAAAVAGAAAMFEYAELRDPS